MLLSHTYFYSNTRKINGDVFDFEILLQIRINIKRIFDLPRGLISSVRFIYSILF